MERIATQAATSRALTPERIAAFVDLVRQKIETADIQARKAYLQVVAPEIRAGDHRIQFIGDKANLAAAITGQQTAAEKVSGLFSSGAPCGNRTPRPGKSHWFYRLGTDPGAGFELRENVNVTKTKA